MTAMPFKQAQSQVPAADGNQYETYLFVDSAQLSYYDVSGGVSSEDIFSLSPVPVSAEVMVTWEFEIEVEGYQIYDIHGQLLQSRAVPLSSGSTVDVSELPAGMYIFTLKLEDGSIDTQKMLVQ
jgi:hypothetical protein